MSRRNAVLTTCVAALAAGSTPAASAPPQPVAALTRIASRLSGLPVRRPVRVVGESPAAMRATAKRVLDRDYPPARQASDEQLYRWLGLLRSSETLRPALLQSEVDARVALYDPVARTLYARSGSSARTATLAALVNALQDQSYDLRRLSRLRATSRDAAFAAAAAVDGHAALVTAALGGRAVSRVLQSHGGSRIRLFLELEHDFSSATGVRFAANLRNLGGNRAVLGALRRFPASSAQIFDVSAYLNAEAAETVVLPERAGAFSLVGSDTFGELDVRALLAVFQVPRLDHVGDGWAGGRSGVYRDPAGRTAAVLAFAWKGTVEAQRWGEAVTTYVNEAFEPDVPGFPATIPCSVDVCWSIAGRGIAARRIGSRTALAIASDVPTAAQLATFAIPR